MTAKQEGIDALGTADWTRFPGPADMPIHTPLMGMDIPQYRRCLGRCRSIPSLSRQPGTISTYISPLGFGFTGFLRIMLWNMTPLNIQAVRGNDISTTSVGSSVGFADRRDILLSNMYPYVAGCDPQGIGVE